MIPATLLRTSIVVVAGVGALIRPTLAQEPGPQAFALTNVTVVDVRDGHLLRNYTVIISGNRITQVASGTQVRIPAAAQVIDAQGRYLIPGLWEMHAHQVRNFLGLYIANGVTGVREMGNSAMPLPQTVALRERIARGELSGPRFFAAGPTVDARPSASVNLVSALNAEQGRAAVDSLRRAGADFIKVYSGLDRDTYFAIADTSRRLGLPLAGHLPNAIGLGEAGRAGQRSVEHLTLGTAGGLLPMCSSQPDSLARTIQELDGMRVGVNVANAPSSLQTRRRAMVRLAVESYDETLCAAHVRQLAAFRMWHTPTLMAGMRRPEVHDDRILQDPRLDYIGQPLRGTWETARANHVSIFTEGDDSAFQELLLRIVRQLHGAGIELLAGTDAPGPFVYPGFSLHEELALLVRAGLTPLEALRTATWNPARYWAMDNSLGSVEAGKLADLVLLDANPLEDISYTQRIRAVVANGRYYDRTALDRILDDARN